MTELALALAGARRAVEEELNRLLPEDGCPEARLWTAMRYAALDGGKRLRAFLVLTSADMFGVARTPARRVAAAVEMIHAYSLVHDDLPAMDDDDWRRGRPSCHRAFDEATAILAGDALLTRAFEILADETTHSDPYVRMRLVQGLARAAGAPGMVGGQMLDLLAEQTDLDQTGVTRLHRMKTGALIQFATTAGALLGRASEGEHNTLALFAHDLGLAFQIVDDLLDQEATAEELGKTPGKDAAAGKATFVAVLGLERAREQAALLGDQALDHLESLNRDTDLLRQVVRFVLERRA